MSKQKDKLLAILQASKTHPSAEELFLACKKENVKISLATVYRNLALLQEEGKIQKISIPNEVDRYDSILRPHAHAVCERCHQIEDIELNGLIDFIQAQTEIKPTSCDLSIRHICAKCRKKEALNIH
ncbi:Fur family transcriptional regulator [Dubosiella newyorkensis]|uniref:Fur family transcriptional regulator n=1 Tax=Dubosiella newyorkensis TaxID=1862672 RepID=UPI002572B9BB|nr:transcriptional repressor [Dubosiella newyorkensis]